MFVWYQLTRAVADKEPLNGLFLLFRAPKPRLRTSTVR